jgi:hypothetical protein
MTDNHTLIKQNWDLFKSDEIKTADELIARNEKVTGPVKVVKVSTHPTVERAKEIFAPHSEKGCPAEEGWENG